jgi:basic endochitinase B
MTGDRGRGRWISAALLGWACGSAGSSELERPIAGSGGQGSASGGGADAGGAAGGSSTSAGGSASGAAGADGASASLSGVLTPELFDAMFPHRDALYAYDALLRAAADYPELGATGTPEQRRRELAAFLGNVAHETTGGWPTAPGGPEAWGLYFIEEVGCEAGACTGYCDSSNARYPCAPGKTYHGRGPIQLSWNYNYGALGDVLGLDLLADPDQVTRDGRIAFTTALWFWMTAQAPKPSAHDVMVERWQPSSGDLAAGRAPGFGMTINIINGGLECGMPTDDRVRDRIRFYRHFATLLGVSEGDNLECASMQSY